MKARRSLAVRGIAFATLLSFISSSCGGRTGTAQKPAPSPLADQVLIQQKDLPDGLDLRISDGKQGAPAFDRAKLAPATKLSDADATALLARATPITADAADKQAFALRERSQPAPRTGNVIKSTFPAPPRSLAPPVTNDAGKDLAVLRYMPEGDVPLAPELSVTFSQPMVAVTSQDDAAKTTPVTLTPQPKGRWRWIGTRTILFDPEVRFPQATTYRVAIAAGTKSATGNVLKEAKTFTFTTPAPKLVASYPPEDLPQKLDVPMFLAFDQRIDPAAVAAKLRVEVNNQPVAIRLLTTEEISKDKRLDAVVTATEKNEQDGRWLAFRATAPFPKDASIDVTIPQGTPSSEGPNTTLEEQSFSFRTYPPLRIDEARCGWGEECPPAAPFTIEFNNPLDEKAFDAAQLTITPEIPSVKIVQSGSIVSVQGLTKARTNYSVTVASGLLDEFGQTLGKDSKLDFRVGDAQPTFFGPQGMVVLDPAAKKPTLDFFSTNYDKLKLKLYQVQPRDYDAFATYMRNLWNRDKPPRMPGKLVKDGTVKTVGVANELGETQIDLTPALAKGTLGHAVAIVEPANWPHSWDPPRMISWVQSTRIGIDAHVDGDAVLAFATDLATGKALSGVQLELRPSGAKATTDAQGIASIPLGAMPKGKHYLVATKGDDTVFVTDDSGFWSEDGQWTKRTGGKNLAWYVIDDRKMYKPGEEVSLKGWLRIIDHGKGGDVAALDSAVPQLTYEVFDQRNVKLATGTTKVSAVGGFDAVFKLPKTPNLGYAYVKLEAKGRMFGTYSHSFQIQEFRRPEFEVSASASQGPFLVGGNGDVTVSAKYFSGGPLAGAETQWYVTTSDASFSPPNRDDFIFGVWEPWWGYRGWGGNDRSRAPRTWSHTAKTDATGAHTLHVDFLSMNPPRTTSVVANASVTDVNRQTWSAAATMLVHPADLYVGLKTKKPFVDKGTPFSVDVIGVDLDGKAAIGTPIELRAVRLDWSFKGGEYKTEEVDAQTCTVTSGKDPVPCTFQTPQGGSYKITATIVDAKGRPNQTQLSFWVSGGDRPPAREVEQERVEIIPDKKEYAHGDTAELLVMAPFYPAEALITHRRSGIVKTERVTMQGPSMTIKVPVTDALVPNMMITVDLVGAAARTDDKGQPDPKLPKRPAYAVGSIDLPIPPKQRTLAVSVAPGAAKLAPGESTKLAVAVRDASGKPAANAEVAVIVVDESVLALSGYQFPDPVNSFYARRSPDASDHRTRANVKLSRPDASMLADTTRNAPRGRAGGGMVPEAAPAQPMSVPPPAPPPPPPGEAEDKKAELSFDAPADAVGYGAPANQPIAIRSNFNPLAAFAPSVITDASGRASVDVKMPDNLTRYRVIAVASAGAKNFGKGESAVTARLPLMVRPSPPRFLNFGDTFKLPVVLQNQTDAPMKVRVAVRATNAAITDGAGREVTVPANDRVEVQFPAAAEMAGTARFQLVGASGNVSDAAELALPVWTPATTEGFATYGVIDSGAVRQPIALPGKVVQQFGGLEVTTSSTNLQALTDAFLYLVTYPFECAEQRSSRVLAIAALKDVLTAFKTKDMPTPAALEASVKADLERLSQMQNYDGGFAFWTRGYPSVPYLSVYVTSALLQAKAKGFAVPQQMLDRAKPFLKNIERYYPWYYSKEVRWAISAYALNTRKQLGDLDIAKGQKLYAEYGGTKGSATMETHGWLLALFAGNKAVETERKELVKHAMNRVSETAGAANFVTNYGDGAYLLLSSDRRVDAVMLDALIQEQKDSDLIPKLVTGLLGHRKAGRWLNTQENTFALLALDRYFQTYEKVTPDFVARVWLGSAYGGDKKFKGRSTDYYQIDIPMAEVVKRDKQDLTIQKDGAGRLYYRVGMTYAPASLKLEPADYGFVVTRAYEAVDNPSDVTRDAQGVWRIKAGARVRVKLNMVNENRRYHVALVDPLPAGLEAMNSALAVTGPIPTDPKDQAQRGAYWWWYGPWYEHQNLRDERTEAFASLLWEGVHTYSYVARATTPGSFVVPPTKAEEMYMPETFGRSGSDRVVIE